jgi:hypothetical protein
MRYRTGNAGGGRLRAGAVALLLLAGGAAAVPAAPPPGTEPIEGRLDTLFGSHEPYRRFLTDLQRAVAAGDRQQIAAMVSYPLRTRLAGQPVRIAGPKQLLAHFDALLPQKSLEVIRTQRFADLFANSQGVMIGSGEVWFSAVCAAADCRAPPIMITALNPP